VFSWLRAPATRRGRLLVLVRSEGPRDPVGYNKLGGSGWSQTANVLADLRDADGMAARLPVGRVGEPEDIGKAALYLTTARHVTGTILHVNGGQALV
jgi:NAD(P)-dependent dehydrogenase (short-subunit alcohol dehydrogenase family)